MSSDDLAILLRNAEERGAIRQALRTITEELRTMRDSLRTIADQHVTTDTRMAKHEQILEGLAEKITMLQQTDAEQDQAIRENSNRHIIVTASVTAVLGTIQLMTLVASILDWF